MNGVLVIDKPAGLTSHDVVARVRRILHERSIGHLGTLDPMATGVLPLVIGRMTRLAQFYNASPKTYEGTIRLGFATDTYDAEGEPISPPCPVNCSVEDIRRAALAFTGEIEQLPPPFSAKKIAGVPAYKLARQKKTVDLQPVRIRIEEFTISHFAGDHITFRAHVSSGTYLRSIARDLGAALGTGGHLASLRRTAVAEFDIAEAHTVDQIESAAAQRINGDGSWLQPLLVHPRRVLPAFPPVTATEESATMIRHGRAVNLPELSRARLVKVFQGQAELIAIAERVAGTLFRPKVVFVAA